MYKYIRIFDIATFEKGVLLVDDVYTETLTGGTYRFWNNDTKIRILKVDTRQLQLEVSGQELLTKDKANKNGEFEYDDLVAKAEKYREGLSEIYENSTLQEKPNKKIVNLLLVRLRERFYNEYKKRNP